MSWDGNTHMNHSCFKQVAAMGNETTCIRSLDWDRDRFDIEFGLEKVLINRLWKELV